MELTKEQQHFFMSWAIALANKGRITAPPNPWVGCVIVKNGEIVGEGYHESAGSLHAEVVALQQAGKKAEGATVYVTLEPCAHFGRTPPCVKALIDAKVSEVVIPFSDPDPQVSGKGIKALREAGIGVTEGVAKEEAEEALLPYLFQRREKIPFTILKVALSLDGRVGLFDKPPFAITGEEARKDLHLLRAESQAILIGSGTALIDRPKLTVRHNIATKKQPLRVVLDGRGQVPAQGPLFDIAMAPTLIVTTARCDPKRIAEWRKTGVEILFFSEEKIPLKKLLAILEQRGVLQLLIEGGPLVYNAFLKENLVSRLACYIGNCILGEEGIPFLSNAFEGKRFSLLNVYRFGDDIRLNYKL